MGMWKPISNSSGGGDETHSHANLITLNKISETNGQLLFDGAPATTPVSIANQWEGKKWVVVGDSISDSEFDTMNNKYHFYVKPKLNIATIYDHAQAGATIAKGTNTNNMVDIINTITTADLITVFGGTNDYGTGKQSGTIDSTDTTTIYGALHHICQRMINYHPNAKYALFTPLRRSNNWASSTGVIKDGRGISGASGLTLENIADIVLEVGEYYSIPVLDLLRKSGIEPSFTTHKDLYMPDGLHPNSTGHERISNVVAEFLRTL